MSPSTPDTEPQPGRLDRVLAYMALGIAALSVICMFVVLVTRWLNPATDFDAVGWQTVAAVPVIGLPIAFGLIILLLIINFVRRSRAGRNA